jgi:AraC family transcriptional regulator
MSAHVIGRQGNYFGAVTRRRVVSSALLAETTYHRGVAIPVHAHEAPNLVLVLAGEFREWIPGRTTRLGAGAISYHPAGDPHAASSHQDGTRAFNIEFLQEEVGVWDRRPRVGDEGRLARIATRILAESRRPDIGQELRIEELVIEFATVMGQVPTAISCAPWLLTVLEQLRAPGTPPTIAAVAERIGVDTSTLYRTFRRLVGCPPSAYVRHLRLIRAREALAQTRLPIGRLAHEFGFYDHAHFTRSFTGMMGMSPLAYRRLLADSA